jgi:acetoin utilization deacetylase AcuC-like enzyme
MKKTGFLYDERYLLHDTGTYHPETSDRLLAIYKGIKEGGLLEKVRLLKAARADLKWIETVHSKAYIRRFEEVCLCGNSSMDSTDNQMCTETYETAFLAVGGILEAARLVMEGELDNVFCAVRPPGHHAENSEAMGFCYFNNVAVCARFLQMEFGIKRVGIVDFDVHHGNATQHMFEQDPTVFYYSVHEHPSFAFPGTGREFEQGSGKGFGFTKNSPALPGQGDHEYKQIVQRDLVPAFERFKPEMLILSTGFDGHCEDDMSGIMLTTEWYNWMMEQMTGMAERYTKGRLISVLEGGYCLKVLPELARNHVKALLGEK